VQLREFTFLEPRSAREASQMLSDHGEEARLMAGGTALLLAARQRIISPSHMVYIGGLSGLSKIEFDESFGLRIGALAKHADVAESPLVNTHWKILADMARHVANPQIRNMGTLGGNLCYGDPSTDPPTCLLALGARVVAVSVNGERTIELQDFLVDYFETALAPDEVITEIQVPLMPVGSRGLYTRFLRTEAEHRPLVGLAAIARCDRGVCLDARVAIGASVPIPVRADRAEQFLRGKKVTDVVIEEAAQILADDITPVDDERGSESYRREMIRVVASRTLGSVFSGGMAHHG
jgi:carbon-monoxide dehydrogenase medium subunit